MTIQVTETLVRHSQHLYHALEERAKPEETQGVTLSVFRGRMSHVFDELGISRSYYTPIMRFMKENDCIQVIQRGSRSVESIVVLQQEPSPEGMSMPPLTGRSKAAMVEARLAALEKSIGGMSIVEALDNHEKRIMALEAKSLRKRGRVSGTE